MLNNYHALMSDILQYGDVENDERTGVGTRAVFGQQLSWNLANGNFPAITTKKLAWKGAVSELLWFLRGSSNVDDLRAILHGEENRFNKAKKTIWDDNYNNQSITLGYENGEMGDIYGVQWRNFGKCTAHAEYYDTEYSRETSSVSTEIKGVDQIDLVLTEAKKNPGSRRLIVSAWNPQVVWNINHEDNVDFNEATLPPCHVLFQFNIHNGYIDLKWYQRSVDTFLGLPFNIASYALLLNMFARVLDLKPRYLIGTFGNAHIYNNHIDAVNEQLSREHFEAPTLWINPDIKTFEDILDSTVDDYKLIDYKHHEPIKAEMVV